MTSLLATKLYLPRLRPNVISRPHLIERLSAGLDRKLTLISAPAGFGKTTLLTAWLAECDRPAAWLSLDDGENDPTRFLTYLIAAVQTIAITVGEGVLREIQSLQPPPLDMLLIALLNDIAAISDQFILILDDYHVIDAPVVGQSLTFLVEHLPPRMHLVIATREDPPLPLARLRARGQLTELRVADLRFTVAEATTFLTEGMRLHLSAADIAQLSDRTEGWIAGLQLAALSLQGQQDVHRFIQAFAGDHRYIVDYLVEEVLHHQPELVRRFLLQTAILDRLSGPLCNAVTGQEDGTARLEALERGNFFVVPLDDQRQWYRYHHLFADVLRTHLLVEHPDQFATLHRRASAWYEQQGEVANAIGHAMSAEDFERAADLMVLAIPDLRRTRQDATLLGWLKRLPDGVIHIRPVLRVGYAYVLLSSDEFESAETQIRDAEQWLEAREHTAEYAHLAASIALYRATHARVLGNLPDIMRYARQALDGLPEQGQSDHFTEEYLLDRGTALAFLGLAFWASGNLETAYQMFADGMAQVQRTGYISDILSGMTALADVRIAQGRLHEAMRIYEHGLQLVAEHGEPVLPGTASLYMGMGELYHEQNDLQTATQYLLKSKQLGERIGFLINRARWCVVMARIQEAQGDRVGALGLLHEAENLHLRNIFPSRRLITALKVRMWIAQGRLGESFHWVQEQDLSVSDDLSYPREFEHITLARVLLARYESASLDRTTVDVMEFLDRLLKAAEAGGRMGSVIEILVLQALAHQMHGDISAALVPLERALTLAEPEGYVRIFANEGHPMTLLLKEATKRGIAPIYVRHLLADTSSDDQRTPAKQTLIEPLSEREHDVLRLLRSDLTGPDIARELVVSPNTMRTHTRNIYSKLGVTNRRAAVHRAEELGLL